MTHRNLALDVFRGLTVAGMILVNTPGSWSHIYPPLRHAVWHGYTPTDLVFPFFLFISGAAMWFSLKKVTPDEAFKPWAFKIMRRAVLIFVIGLSLNAFPFYDLDLSKLRIMGVLQRIGLAYGIAGLLVLSVRVRSNLTGDHEKVLMILSMVILAGYQIVLVVFGSDDPYGLETNIVRAVDLSLFGASHLWQGTGTSFDPEGLLSTAPAAVSVIMGYLTSRWISNAKSPAAMARGLALAGVGCLVFGMIWGQSMPINKALWTSSYVMVTTGWALIVLGILVFLIDIMNVKRWCWVAGVFGSNPLFSYVLSIVWVKIYLAISLTDTDGGPISLYGWIYWKGFEPLFGALHGSFLFAVVHVGIFWLAALVLYRRKIFIKI